METRTFLIWGIRTHHFSDIQRDQANDHSQTEAMENTHCYEHRHVDRSSRERSTNECPRASNRNSFLTAKPVAQPALCDSPKGRTRCKERLDSTNDADCEVSVNFSDEENTLLCCGWIRSCEEQ